MPPLSRRSRRTNGSFTHWDIPCGHQPREDHHQAYCKSTMRYHLATSLEDGIIIQEMFSPNGRHHFIYQLLLIAVCNQLSSTKASKRNFSGKRPTTMRKQIQLGHLFSLLIYSNCWFHILTESHLRAVSITISRGNFCKMLPNLLQFVLMRERWV